MTLLQLEPHLDWSAACVLFCIIWAVWLVLVVDEWPRQAC